jgi:hypothetical protein
MLSELNVRFTPFVILLNFFLREQHLQYCSELCVNSTVYSCVLSEKISGAVLSQALRAQYLQYRLIHALNSEHLQYPL